MLLGGETVLIRCSSSEAGNYDAEDGGAALLSAENKRRADWMSAIISATTASYICRNLPDCSGHVALWLSPPNERRNARDLRQETDLADPYMV